jgi:di/tricarboxylate transporter
MNWEGWFTLALLVVMVGGLARYSHLADVIFLGGLTLLSLAGILTPAEALSGFSNDGMLTVAALFVVAAALRETGALEGAARRLLGAPSGQRRALLRLTAPVAAVSAFLNNTTVVAMALPVVLDWCRKHRLSPSRFLIPLSYAAVAGGVCTLIGTSTNLVVHGLMLDQPGLGGMGFLEIGKVGLPLTVVTLAYLVLFAQQRIPERAELLEDLGARRREYMVEMLVEPSCPLIGSNIQEAGLRRLPGLFLVEISRPDGLISPVGPDEKLRAGDRLVFAGVVGTIVDLQKIRGLTPVKPGPADEPGPPGRDRRFCEAVVSASSPLVGVGIREANFRTVYDAAVIAVHRNGARLAGKIGDIVVRPGDTLLLQTGPGFFRAHRNNPDFYLVSEVRGAAPVRHEKAGAALAVLAGLVALMALPDVLEWVNWKSPLSDRLDRGRVIIALAAAGLVVVARCLPSSAARRSIQWDVLLVIAASFGVAKALLKTGAAGFIADTIQAGVTPIGPVGALAAVYLLTTLLTELLTNNAAAALAFPIAISSAATMGLDPRPFAIVVAIAGSGGFAMPLGYQTHLMVFGPGGYRLADFLRAGLPLDLLWFLTTIGLVPLFWPLARQ